MARFINSSKVFSILFLIAVAFLSAAHGADKNENVLTVGYSSKLFFDVDVRDAHAATKVWTDMLVRKMGSTFDRTEVTILQNPASIEERVKAKAVDVVALYSNEFLEIRKKLPLVPVYAMDYGKDFYQIMELLVREDSGIKRLTDLKQRRMVIELGQKGNISSLWLGNLLLKEGIVDMKDYFSILKEANRASQAVLPVFFRQADGCVVGKNNYETMTELNPQVGKELKVIATSPGFLTGVVCLTKDFVQTYSNLLDAAITTVYTEPQGKQLMTLFRINKIVTFKEEYLQSVEFLLREHRDLAAKLAQRR